ncbi:MAG: hypothetical protein Q8R98_13845, partial [Rubrivivax sp.]|nr:hypothetical protein [Rubrivivax sp.]
SGPEVDGAADTLAAAGTVPSGVVQVSNAAGRAAAPTAAGALIRDARLDEFLRAHQSARGGFAAAVPGSALRRVDAEMPAGVQR